MIYTTTTADILTTAIERAGHAWVLVLIGALVVGLGVIVLVAGAHRRTTRNGKHRPDAPASEDRGPGDAGSGHGRRCWPWPRRCCSRGAVPDSTGTAGSPSCPPGDRPSSTYPAGQRGSIDDLSGPDLTGEGTISLSDYPDTVIVLNVWGSWCGPCRGEADGLNLASTLTADKGVQFIGINVKDTRDAGADFHRARQVPYPSIYDPSMRTLLSIRGFPTGLDPVDHHPGPRTQGGPDLPAGGDHR